MSDARDILTSESFSFEVPRGWRREREGNRIVLSDGAETFIIVSATRCTPPSRDVVQKLIDNAFAAVESGASNPELVTIDSLAERPAYEGLRSWWMTSESTDRLVLLSQAVIASECAVMLVTVESPADPVRHRATFSTFVSSVRSNPAT